MMMKLNIYSITRWTLLFAFVLSFSQWSVAQTLTISDGGQTGTSGTNWSVSGSNPITITAAGGDADVNSSVVEAYLNAGTSVLLDGARIIVNNPLEKTAGGNASLTIRAAGTNTNSHGRVSLYSNITSTSGALDVVLWSDYNHHNKGGISVFTNNAITTNGGHFWAGGSTSAQGESSWNGLTVGDGPAVGSAGNNYNALDFYDVDLNTGGGDVFLWAGQGYSTGFNGIAFNSTIGQINSGTGDVVLVSDVFAGGTTITSTGHLYLAPHDGAYPSAVTWSHNSGSPNINMSGTFDALNINAFNNLGGLTIGEYDGMSGVDFSNTSDVTISSATTIAGPVSVYGRTHHVNADVQSTGVNQAITFVARGLGTGALTNGLILLNTNSDLTTNDGNIILWANAENLTTGQKNNEIILAGTNVLTSNGGKIVLAGGLDDGSNDGVASDGIPDGYAYRGGYGGEAVDIRTNVTLDSDGGEIIIRGEQNGTDAAIGTDATFTIANAGAVTLDGKNTSDNSVRLGTSNITSTTANADISILGSTHLANNGLVSITTQGGDVLLSANSDDATDGESAVNGQIRMISGLSITTNGGNITLGGGDETASGYALGSSSNALISEGIRIDHTANLNSGGGNIALRGKTPAIAVSGSVGASGIMFFNIASGTVNSGTGTILMDGHSQTSGGVAIAGLLWWNDPSAGTFTVQSANTSSSAIVLNGFSTGTSGQAYGIEVEGQNTLNLLATASGGGITLSTGNSIANYYDAVFRGPLNIQAVDGPIALKGGQLGGVANGYFFSSNNVYLGSKSATSITSSSSDILIEFDRFELPGGTPFIATDGGVTWQPNAASFGMAVNTNFFSWNQNSQTMSALTVGKTGNTANVTHQSAITVAGPISMYGGDVTLNDDLTGTGDILISGTTSLITDNVSRQTIASNNGNISILMDSDANGSGNLDLDRLTVNAGNGDIIVRGEAFGWGTDELGVIPIFNGTGSFTFEPSDDSFVQGLDLGAWIRLNDDASTFSSITVGKSTNTADINLTSSAIGTSSFNVAGPISIYGGDIAVDGSLTATAADINLTSSGTVTQSAALTANGLSLNGTGNFTLQNSSNNVATLVGGESDTRVGNIAYRDADALELGTVGAQSGIFSSGTILVETENDDLTLSQNINTTSSANDAIILNAGRASSVGTETGGDIIVSGTPTLTIGAGGISKLFSGTDANSTGLTTLVGAGNVLYDLDETSDLSGESLTGDNAYAIYRAIGNTPPIVTSTSITTATAQSLYFYDIQASDAENDLITWTENTVPDWLTFTSGILQTNFLGTGVNPTNTGDGVNQSPDGTSASSAVIRAGTAAHGDDKLFFTDTEEYGVRYVDANGNVQTWYQGDGEYTSLNPSGIAYDVVNDAVYVGDYASTDILKIDNSGTLSLLSDLPEPFMFRLLVNSTGTKLYASARGGIYEIDLANNDPAANWTRVVGTGSMGYSDTGIASTSQVSQPHGMAFDSAGRLVFTDRFNDLIRRVNLTTDTIETIAGTQGAGVEAGDGGPAVDATFADPSGLVINQQDEIFISERLSKRIRRIDSNGDIDTFFTVSAGGFADDLVISDGGELFLLTTNLIAQVSSVAELTGTPTNADAGVHDVSLTLSDGEFDVPYQFQITVIAVNSAPTDITLDNNSINQSATGVDAAVGTLSTTDADAGDTHTYALVAGTGDTDNSSFNIDASSLRTNSALSPGTYSVRINTNDGSEDFAKAFTIIVNDDVAPNPPSLPDLTGASDSCDSDDDDITIVTTPTFTGTADANATVNLLSSVDGSIGSAAADGSGNWSITSTSLSLGTHTITSTATDAATNTSGASDGLSVIITTLDDASFSYSAAAYCTDASDPTPTITGAAGGNFASTAGLSINASTGAIDVSASTPGTYTVTYTTAGTCSNSSEVSVTINSVDDASFNYSAAAYCADASDPTPTITGAAGGTFSSTEGLSIDASTGAIDVSASTPETYTVTYTTTGICPNSSEVAVTINAVDDASFEYATAAYCADASDPTPTITGAAGGTFSSTEGLSINASTGAIDVSASTPGAYTVTYTTAGTCSNSSEVAVSINSVDDASFEYATAAYCADASDPTPTITGTSGGTFNSTFGLSIHALTGAIDVSVSMLGTYTVTYTTAGTCPISSEVAVTINAVDDASFEYATAAYCVDASDPTPTITGAAGGTFSSTEGLSIDASTGAIAVSASTPGTYTVTYTTAGTCSTSSEVAVTINAADDASFEYSAAAYCADASDPSPTITGAAGGTFSSTEGLSIDAATGAIAVSASTPGTYTVTYTTAGTCSTSSEASVTINALDDASFSYDLSTFEVTGIDPLPTVTGDLGGSFTSSTGLSIDGISGLIDLSESVLGTYLVTYTTLGPCVNSSAFELIIENTQSIDNPTLGLSSLTLYPNPANSVLQINNPNQIALQSISIFDLSGRMVENMRLNNMYNPTIDVAKLESATYVIKITTQDSRQLIDRFIKQ